MLGWGQYRRDILKVHQDYVRFSFLPKFGQASANGADLVDGGRRWLLDSTLPDGVLPTCQITRLGFAGITSPKSIALGRCRQAADSFVDYGDDGRGTVALQKL
jgi:hypothetical protein